MSDRKTAYEKGFSMYPVFIEDHHEIQDLRAEVKRLKAEAQELKSHIAEIDELYWDKAAEADKV